MTESTQREELNRNGDREIRRQVGNRQGDKYGNKWEARRILRHRAPRRVMKSILCPEAPRKKNSNREGQKEMKRGDCNKAVT